MTENRFRIGGKVVLVTGAGKGIGRACALALADAGAQVIAVACTREDLESLRAEANSTVDQWVGDVCDPATVARVRELSSFDILVNNAGTNRLQHVSEVDDETLDIFLALNVRAAFKMAQAAAAIMV